MRNTRVGRSLSSLISHNVGLLVALLLLPVFAKSLEAQVTADTTRRVVLVSLAPPSANTDLTEATIREALVTLDTLRESRHLQLVANQDVERILRASGYPNSLALTTDVANLAKVTACVAAVGVTVERQANGYRLLTRLVLPNNGSGTTLSPPIDGSSISAVAQSLARLVASDSTIRNARR